MSAARHSPASTPTVTPSLPAGAPVRLRVLPVPVSEPRGIGDLTHLPRLVGTAQGALALGLPALREQVAGPSARPPAPGTSLPDPAATVGAVVKAVVEVLAGIRPPAQLLRWVSRDVHATVSERAALTTRMRRGAPAPARQVVVRGVRVCRPAAGVVEASAVVVDGTRVRAVAVRLEDHDGRWRATALEVG